MRVINDGSRLEYTAGGTVTAGVPVVVGSIPCVPLNNGESGDKIVAVTTPGVVVDLPLTGTITIGDPAYLNAGEIDHVDNGNIYGYFWSGDVDAGRCAVKLALAVDSDPV